MILIDTHIWIWWVTGSPELPDDYRAALEASRLADGVAVSVYSCWEIALKVSKGKLKLDKDVDEWIHFGLHQRGVTEAPVTREILVESTRLPGDFHKDPADRIIVATSRVEHLPLMTCDRLILEYPEVELWKPL